MFEVEKRKSFLTRLLSIVLGLISIFAISVKSLNAPGQKTNKEYKISQYYGSRDKEFYYISNIINDKLTVVRWSESIDYLKE